MGSAQTVRHPSTSPVTTASADTPTPACEQNTLLAEIQTAFFTHDLVRIGEDDGRPVRIGPGHPVRELVAELEGQYPDAVLPAAGRKNWRRLLAARPDRPAEFFDAVDDFLAWVEGEVRRLSPDGYPVPGTGRNGLIAPNQLRWNGRQVRVAPQVYHLLGFIWPRQRAVIDDVIEILLGAGKNRRRRLASAVHRANAALGHVGVPWLLSVDTPYLMKVGDGGRDGESPGS